jgi:hypothetical protein
MRYEFKMVPADPKSLAPYLNEELFKIAQAISLPRDETYYEPQYRAPLKPRRGMVVYADGTSWNPTGAGEGLYRFNGSIWVFLG